MGASHTATGRAITGQLGSAQVVSEVLPADNAGVTAKIQADVGIAIGTGTDVVVDAADITLVRGDVTGHTTMKERHTTFGGQDTG